MKNLKYIENLLTIIVGGLFLYQGLFTADDIGYYGAITIITIISMTAFFWLIWFSDPKLFIYAKTIAFLVFILLSIMGIKSGEKIYLISGLLSILGSLINHERIRKDV